MRACVYARRSTDEHQAASLDVQLEEARRYIGKKGWTLREEHIFLEDAVSRAEFKKRPALLAMLNAAERKSFDVVVVRDETRLGGDVIRTGLLIQDILDASVNLFYYFTDEEVSLDDATAKFMVAARNFASELEREKIAQRTHEHLLTKARHGLNAGGRCYGYDNVEITEGERRVRVEYAINDQQAEVVRDIFQRYSSGEGLKAIAKGLNGRGVPPPRAGKRGTGSWSPSCIRSMLHNERYRGRLVWGKKEKTYRRGTKVRVDRPEDEWVCVDAEHLQIVDETLWDAVVARQQRHVRLSGRQGQPGPSPRHLLSGIARCGLCGGPMQAVSGKVSRAVTKLYVCSYHRCRGDSVCDNSLRRPVEAVDAAVVEWIEQNVLREEIVVEVLREVQRRLRQQTAQINTRVPELEAEIEKVKAELDRLSDALLATDDKPHCIVKMMSDREATLADLRAQIAASRNAPSIIDMETRRMEREARARLSNLRSLFHRNPKEARQALEAMLEQPIKFTPTETTEGRRYQVEGEFSVGTLFTTDSVPRGI